MVKLKKQKPNYRDGDFLFRREWYLTLKELSQRERLKCIETICEYAQTGELPPNTTRTIKAITAPMVEEISKNREKANLRSNINSENAKKRWNKI